MGGATPQQGGCHGPGRNWPEGAPACLPMETYETHETMETRREINGYPFTTFDFSRLSCRCVAKCVLSLVSPPSVLFTS